MAPLLPIRFRAVATLMLMLACGCGTTQDRGATDQLLISDAVDRAVGQLDFRVLSGERVYLDTKYLKNVKGAGFVNADYIISSLRQQMVAANCLLQDNLDDADFVVEARIGALGTDHHKVVYGIPPNNALGAASTLFRTLPPLPAIPEISFGKKDNQLAAAKIGVFAYNRETRSPVWQSGVSIAKSTAKNFWLFGAGPFQQGTIYDGTQFAGSRIGLPLISDDPQRRRGPEVAYDEEFVFREPSGERDDTTESVQQAGADKSVDDDRAPNAVQQAVHIENSNP